MDRDDMELFLTTHESTAVSIADGLSRATRAPSVVYLHANGGLTNGLSQPCRGTAGLFAGGRLNGLKPRSIQSRSGFTTARRMRDLVHQYVKDDWQSLTSDGIAEDVNRAFRTAMIEPAGPVWVGLSQDLLEAPSHAAVVDTRRFAFDSRTVPVGPGDPRRCRADRGVRPSGDRGGQRGRQIRCRRGSGPPQRIARRAGPARGPPCAGASRIPHRSRELPRTVRSEPPAGPQRRPDRVPGRASVQRVRTAGIPADTGGAKVIQAHTDARQIASHPRSRRRARRRPGPDRASPARDRCRRSSATSSRRRVPSGRSRRDGTGALKASDVIDVITQSLRGAALVGDATTAGGVLQRRRSPAFG